MAVHRVYPLPELDGPAMIDVMWTQGPTDPAPLLTYYAELMKIGTTHTRIPDTDPPTTPPSQVIGHNDS
jgi:hypothetical protein